MILLNSSRPIRFHISYSGTQYVSYFLTVFSAVKMPPDKDSARGSNNNVNNDE